MEKLQRKENRRSDRTASYDLGPDESSQGKNKYQLNLPNPVTVGQGVIDNTDECTSPAKLGQQTAGPPGNGLGLARQDDATENSGNSGARLQTRAPSFGPYQLIHFDIKKHELQVKKDFVVYYLEARTARAQWTVESRYNNFNLLNSKLLKKKEYEGRIPKFPAKSLWRKSKEVIEERKILLAQYLTKLSQSINIFKDQDIMQFLRKDSTTSMIRELSQEYETNKELQRVHSPARLLKSQGSSSEKAKLNTSFQKKPNLEQIKARAHPQLTVNVRKRVFSHELHSQQIGSHPVLQPHQSPSVFSQDQWSSTQYESLDAKIIAFLEFLNEDKENQSQLINQFDDYYFSEKPEIPEAQIKRLFYGYLRKDGFINLLKECHTEIPSIKTRAIIQLFVKLMDNNKCHQPDDFKNVWRNVKPQIIMESKFGKIINQNDHLKKYIFILLSIYLEGRLFLIENLIKDDVQACQKYTVWMKQRSKQNCSFASAGFGGSSSSLDPSLRSSSKGREAHKKSLKKQLTTRKLQSFSSNLHKKEIHPNNNALSIDSPMGRASMQEDQKSFDDESLDNHGPASDRNAKPVKKIGYNRTFFSSMSRNAECESPGVSTKNGLDSEQNSESSDALSSESATTGDLLDVMNKMNYAQAKESIYVSVPTEYIKGIKNIKIKSLEESKNENEHWKPIPVEFVDDQSPGGGMKQIRMNLYEFDINAEIKNLIKRYLRKTNFIYSLTEVENLSIQEVFGKVNQYVFSQKEYDSCYKIKLQSFRQLIEGVKLGLNKNKSYENSPEKTDINIENSPSKREEDKTSTHKSKFNRLSSQLNSNRSPVITLFNDLDVEVINEIDEFTKIVRYSFKRKYSKDFNYSSGSGGNQISLQNLKNVSARNSTECNQGQEHTMLLNYQVIGQNSDRACISIFEFDEIKCQINPNNFIVITQSIQKKAAAQLSFSSQSQTSNNIGNNSSGGWNQKGDQDPTQDDNLMACRALSEVVEDPHEYEPNSFSMKHTTQSHLQNAILQQQIQEEKAKYQRDQFENQNEFSGSGKEGLEEQNDLLFESNFQQERSAEKLRANGMVFERGMMSNSYTHQNSCFSDAILGETTKNESVQSNIKSSITSSLTAKSSGGPGEIPGQQLSGMNGQDVVNQPNYHNQFDDVLKRASGDIQVIMRISHDSYLLERILGCMKHMAYGVKMSLHDNL